MSCVATLLVATGNGQQAQKVYTAPKFSCQTCHDKVFVYVVTTCSPGSQRVGPTSPVNNIGQCPEQSIV